MQQNICYQEIYVHVCVCGLKGALSGQLPIIRGSHAQTHNVIIRCRLSCQRGSYASLALIGSSDVFTVTTSPGKKGGK